VSTDNIFPGNTWNSWKP